MTNQQIKELAEDHVSGEVLEDRLLELSRDKDGNEIDFENKGVPSLLDK